MARQSKSKYTVYEIVDNHAKNYNYVSIMDDETITNMGETFGRIKGLSLACPDCGEVIVTHGQLAYHVVCSNQSCRHKFVAEVILHRSTRGPLRRPARIKVYG